MNEFATDVVLLGWHRLLDGTRILRIVFAQVNDDVFHACLFDAVRGRRDEVTRDQHTAALIAGDADVRLPWVLAKLRFASADDSFLQGVVYGPRNAAFDVDL